MVEKIHKTEEEWHKILNPEQYEIMRNRGTEAPFSCVWEELREGEYNCAACDLPLFLSKAKFESGTGWPSFFEPLAADHLEEVEDISRGMRRTEVICTRCESHLGHVFPDGPPPSGKRYCINSIVLKFFPKENVK